MDTDFTKYRLTFGEIIALKGNQPEAFQLEQGTQKTISDTKKVYSLLLRGIKVNRKIYQPTEIEAELDIVQNAGNISHQQTTTAPQFEDIRNLLLQRRVTLDTVDGKVTIAKNCYVYEMIPQLQHDVNGTKMYVKLSIFSMDKLMTINKYSKAYVARKLGSEILQQESLNFGNGADGKALIDSDVSSQQHLTYTDTDMRLEFIQPYLVQYNESFYDFLVRTSNRCGEFLYFEDGKLVLGLPDSGKPVEIENYKSVTALERSVDPLIISDYTRDSVKDGIGALKDSADASLDSSETHPILNISAIPREATGFPKDAFPTYTSSNSELAQDDYIFPLYKYMFTNRKRELNYDGSTGEAALARIMPFCKTLLSNEIDGVLGGVLPIIIESIIGEGIPTMLADMRVLTYNSSQATRYIDILKTKSDQYNELKGVQFGTLNALGWTTLNYYQDIHLHEDAQQRKIVCINMGTNFINVKLGQKIKIKGLDDVYVIIQIQQNSEEAWNRDYDRYGMVADDKYAGTRSLKIYAIPGYGEDKDQFIPPVQPVPVIRKVGPQTAFVTDNEDPKFQGRVRVAFPWQSFNSPERAELNEVNVKLHELKVNLDTLKSDQQTHLSRATRASQRIEELKDYVEATKENREVMLKSKNEEIEKLQKEIDASKESNPPIDTTDKEAQKQGIQSDIDELKEAAEEHDKKKGTAGYQDLEKDNTVISKYKVIYEQENKLYLSSKANYERTDVKKNETDKKCEELKKDFKAALNTMATPWVRVVTPMATPGGGTFFRPRVGDEVLVNFENDNVERPYVMGSVFSKNNLTPDEKMYRQRGVELQGKDVSMAMMSPNGHHITFTDPEGGANFVSNLISPGLGLWGTIVGAPFTNLMSGAKDLTGGIHIGDRYGIYEIDMKSHKRAIEINSPYGTVSINAFNGITINAPNGEVTIRGKNINLEAGNKVNIRSGMNIEDPSLGDPEGGAYIFGKVMTDIFAEIVPGEITKYFFSSIVDLSYIRHVVEVFVRPVDGTLKLKSKRYLMLEAGFGNATIRRDRYAAEVEEKKQTQEEFFKAMLTCVKFICEKIDLFYATYESLWIDGYKKRDKYEDIGKSNLKDVKNPNVVKLASEKDEWNDDVITKDLYKDCFESSRLVYDEDDSTIKYLAMKEHADAYGESAFNMYEHVRDLLNIMAEDELELGSFNWIRTYCGEALKMVDDKCKCSKDWMDEFANGHEDNLFKASEPDPKSDKFAMANEKLFKRKVLLSFISKVGEAPENEKGKYYPCGLRIDEILAADWIKQEFYWNRTVFNLDRSKRVNHNNYRRKLYDNFCGLIVNTAKKFVAPLDRHIWNDKADGQILFSDQENKTLNFQGEGLHEENDSNIGTLDHLKKELMAIK